MTSSDDESATEKIGDASLADENGGDDASVVDAQVDGDVDTTNGVSHHYDDGPSTSNKRGDATAEKGNRKRRMSKRERKNLKKKRPDAIVSAPSAVTAENGNRYNSLCSFAREMLPTHRNT
jgi:hypothetical protein